MLVELAAANAAFAVIKEAISNSGELMQAGKAVAEWFDAKSSLQKKVEGKPYDQRSDLEEFFALENWNFGETFYWSELSAYIMQSLAPDLHSIVLVPNSATDSFGSLFEVKSENDEIFISGATVDNVEIITAITAERLKASGAIVTSVNDTSQAVSSSSETVVTTTSSSSNSGGSSY